MSDKSIKCNYCNAELPLGLKFCTECGKPLQNDSRSIKENFNQKSVCPNCSAEVSPYLKFCTECGTSLLIKMKPTNENINRELHKRRGSYKTNNYNENPKNTVTGFLQAFKETVDTKLQPVDTITEFINNATTSAGEHTNKLSETINNSSKPSNRRIIKPKKKAENNGYLVCDSCGGYYELQLGEAPDDFSDECDCGGNLKYYKSLP